MLTQAVAPIERAPTGAQRRLRVLVFSSLFPSPARPRHGIFVETRVAQLIKEMPVDVRVVAPVPWFPSTAPRYGDYAAFAATPRHATRPNGVAVSYPRYLMLPRIGIPLQPGSMARGALRDIVALQRGGWQPDLIDAHYLYPDGVAAAWLARRLDIPFVMTARGTDVNVLAALAGPGRRITEAAGRAEGVVAVSGSLKGKLVALGVDAAKIVVLRNGVDLAAFPLADRALARARLGLREVEPLLLSVGNLLPEKGQALAIESLQHLPGTRLLIVGDGPSRAALGALARRLGLESRVGFNPTVPQRELHQLYGAADALLVTSTREGWPNVVLESMACGTPVVTCDVGAVREMITNAGVGGIVTSREPAEFAAAIARVLAGRASRLAIRQHAAAFDWATVSRGQMEMFERALSGRAGAAESRRDIAR